MSNIDTDALAQQISETISDDLDEHRGDPESGGGLTEEDVIQLIEEHGSGGLSEDDVVQLIDEHASGGDGLTRDEVENVVVAALEDVDVGGEFNSEVLERVRYHAEALDFPARRVGPAEPTGDYHANPHWGIHFRTGRECYIRSAMIDAKESGSFRVQLGTYDGDEFEVTDETTIEDVEKGEQRVDLGLQVPNEDEYLLATPDDFPLRRGRFSDWDDHMVDNLCLIGGDRSGDFDPNDYWYKLFDLEITANENHEFPQ